MPKHEDFALRAVRDWKTHMPTLDATDDEIMVFVRLSRVSALKDRIDERTLRPFESEGVRGAEDFRALALLRRSPQGLSNSELIEQLGGSKGGMSARLDRFSSHDICERTRSTIDRRSHTNTLTERGHDLAGRLVVAVVRDRGLLIEMLTTAEVKSLSHMLAKVIETVDPGG